MLKQRKLLQQLFDPAEENIMKRSPRKPDEKILSANMVWNIIVMSILMLTSVLYIFNYGLSESLIKAQTLALTTIVLLEFARVYVIRKEYKARVFSNKYLVFAMVASTILQVLVNYPPLNVFLKLTPLNLVEWAYITALVIVVFILSFISNKVIAAFTKELDKLP